MDAMESLYFHAMDTWTQWIHMHVMDSMNMSLSEVAASGLIKDTSSQENRGYPHTQPGGLQTGLFEWVRV